MPFSRSYHPSKLRTSRRLSVRLAYALFLAALATCAHAQLPSPDMGKPDVYQAQIGECQRLSMGEPAKAASFAQSFLNKSDLTLYATIMFTDCLAHSRLMANDFKGALDAENRALQLLDASKMPDSVQANIFSNAGGMFQTTGDTEHAAILFRKALAKSGSSPPAKVAALMNIATLYEEVLSDPSNANPYFHQAYDLTRAIGQEDPYIDFAYGDNLLHLNNFDAAGVLLDRVGELTQGKEIYASVNARANVSRAKILLARGEPEPAHKLLLSAVARQHQNNDTVGEAYALVTLGNLQLQEKNYEAALSAARRIQECGHIANSSQIQVDGMHLEISAESGLGHLARALAVSQQTNETEVSQLKAQNTRSLAGYESQLKDQAVQLQNEQLLADADLQALRSRRNQQARDILIAVLAVLLLVGGAFLQYQRRVSRKLHTLSTTDPLSGLLNRREASRILNESRHDADKAAFRRTGLFLIDVDHFKSINDQYGHDAGDLVLTELSARFCAACRPDDLVARWGGEEFLVASWRLTPAEASDLAERLRASAASRPIQLSEKLSVTVTVSIGFALHPFFPTETGGAWREAAYLTDRALYSAKHSGRDAWAGIWGTPQAQDIPIRAVHEDPEAAIAKGWVAWQSNKQLIWRIASETSFRQPHNSAEI